MPCICLFIDHEYCDDVSQMLGEFATRELKRLEDGEYQPVIETISKVIGKLLGKHTTPTEHKR